MSLLAIGTGLVSGYNQVISSVNSGACGQKCYGIGKKLKNCRRKRTQACEAEKQAKERSEKLALIEEQKILDAQNKGGIAAASLGQAGAGLSVGMKPLQYIVIALSIAGALFFSTKK